MHAATDDALGSAMLPAAGRISPNPWVLALDRRLGGAIEALVAALIVAEIAILFMGVVSRYFLQMPLVWSDEVASLLFLWLVSLGAVVAFRRGEHMRMTALVAKASPKVRAFLDTVAITAALAFQIGRAHV